MPARRVAVGRARRRRQLGLRLDHGHVVIAAITSCTNTSNPSVMIAAGLLAKRAVERGLSVEAVGQDLARARLPGRHRLLRAGRAHPVPRRSSGSTSSATAARPASATRVRCAPEISAAIDQGDLAVAAVLSGNRNFEGRINPDVRMNYLASPPLVVAYALAGTMDIDLYTEPLGTGTDGEPVFLRDIWPGTAEVADVVAGALRSDMFTDRYASLPDGDDRWRTLPVAGGDRYEWDDVSTYVHRPPFFDEMGREPDALADIEGARVLAVLGDSVTTDHISPAGVIRADRPAGRWLQRPRRRLQQDFNSYGSRRGNHEVMVRGTFANIRLRNQLAPGTEGGVTVHLPDGEQQSIYDAAMRYLADGVPLVVLAGTEYGSGSSRDWAAKGTLAARRTRRARRVLRADPPLQPHRHGRPPAPVPRRP